MKAATDSAIADHDIAVNFAPNVVAQVGLNGTILRNLLTNLGENLVPQTTDLLAQVALQRPKQIGMIFAIVTKTPAAGS